MKRVRNPVPAKPIWEHFIKLFFHCVRDARSDGHGSFDSNHDPNVIMMVLGKFDRSI